MKKTLQFTAMLLAVLFLVSCGSAKQVSLSSYSTDGKLKPAVESTISNHTSLEGAQTRVENAKMQGIEMSEALSDDGTQMIKRPYKWYAGTGKADNKQVAIELAQREAYATISRVLSNAVKDEAERGNVANNGKVQQALTSHWEQFSTSLQRGCEPFGNTTIEYDPSTRMYTATAKVAIRGDRFNQLLNTAGNFKPTDLSGADLDQFIETNKAVMNAAKGN